MPSSRVERARVVAELAAARQRLADLEQEQGYASFAPGWSRRPEDLDVELARVDAEIVALEERLAELEAPTEGDVHALAPANDVAPALAGAPASPPERASAPEAEYLSTAEAAALLGMSPRTLEGLRLRGEGPPHIKLGRRVLYPVEALRGLARSQAK